MFGSGAMAQTEVNRLPSCGVGCSHIFLKLHGYDVPLADLRARFQRVNPQVDLRKISCYDLRQVMEMSGLLVATVRIKPSRIGELPLPAILYLRPEHLGRDAHGIGHFIVLESIDNGQARVFDPAHFADAPIQQIRTDQLSKVWDGEAVIQRTPRRRLPLIAVAVVVGLFGLARLFQRRRVLCGFGLGTA